MQALIGATKTLYTIDQANLLAANMNKTDPDWKYVAKHDPEGKGWSFVEIFDEDGQKIGVM